MGCPFSQKCHFSFWDRVKRWLSFLSKESEGPLSPENLQAILDNTVDSVVTINEQSIILAFNKTAEKMFGYTKEEVIGSNVHILMPEPFYSQHDSYVQTYLKTGKKKIIGIGREVMAKRKDGSIFPMDIAVSEVLLGSKRLFTAIMRDISQKKESEALALVNTKMEAELKAKNEYVSILSHELRTPLTSIHGSLGLLMAEEGVSEKMKDLLSIAYRTSLRLIKIVNDVLDIGKIQSGKLTIENHPLSMAAVVREAIRTSTPIAEEIGITLAEEGPFPEVTVFGDFTRLIQVLMNLIANAIKFSPPQGQVFISLKVIEKRVRVSVRDQGKGIPEDFKDKIFTPFSQGSNRGARVVGGTGLGLHICKCLVEQMGGTIGFTTEIGKGSTFYFELPIYFEEQVKTCHQNP